VKKRRPSEDTAGVLTVLALFLLVRGGLLARTGEDDPTWFLVRGALLVPLALLVWRRWRPAVALAMAGDVLDGLRVTVHAVEGSYLPSFLGLWVRMVLLWLLALCWRDLSSPPTDG